MTETARDAFSGNGSRHDAAVKGSLALLRLAEQGHLLGVRGALAEAGSAFVASVTTGSGARPEREAEAEWQRAVQGGAALVLGSPTDPEARGCRCGDADELDPAVAKELRNIEVRETARAMYRARQADRHGGEVADGATFLLDAPPEPAPEWGLGSRVLWARGEGLLIVGPQGVGKTTTAQQLVLARMGLRDGELFGLPVVVDERPVLYLAMDRPAQVRRSWLRMMGEADRELLKKRLRVWAGPLPFDPLADADVFADWIDKQGVGAVVVDSYKDLASPLTDDGVGGGVNAAMQRVLARGVEWVGLHHHRKAQTENKRPRRLDDVYGSVWLTAGTGSVVLLWGEPGAGQVELSHLKQPQERVGPLLVSHGGSTGVSAATDPEQRLLVVLEAAGSMTETEAAEALYGGSDNADRKRARRLLDRLTESYEGTVVAVPGQRGGSGGGGAAARWRWEL